MVDWKRLARAAGLAVRDEEIEVRFADGRSQRVRVEEGEPGTLRAWALCGYPSRVARLESPELYAWLRNRLVDLVGFRLDSKRRLISETFVAVPGLTPDEWALHVGVVARAADRLQYLLTGRESD